MRRKRVFGMLLFLGVTLAVVATVLAAPQAFSLPWWTVDGGGGTSSRGGYTLSGTLSQPDAGVLTGGGYTCVQTEGNIAFCNNPFCCIMGSLCKP